MADSVARNAKNGATAKATSAGKDRKIYSTTLYNADGSVNQSIDQDGHASTTTGRAAGP